jgi:uncharacterized damage-inducible protein DinB
VIEHSGWCHVSPTAGKRAAICDNDFTTAANAVTQERRMDRKTLLSLWEEAETNGLWAAPWNKCVADIAAEQATWKPGGERHSIWQLVHHIVFWREHELRTLAGKKPDDEEIARRNWEAPSMVTSAAWGAARRRLEETHRQIREAIANEGNPLDRLRFVLPHDCYHFGQIMYVRALQGLAAVL